MSDGVVKASPVPNDVALVADAYQLIVPMLAVAFNTTVPVPQRLAGVVLLTVGMAVTVAATAVRADVQLLSVASTK